MPPGTDEDDNGLVDPYMPNGNTDNEDGEIHIKWLPPDVIPVQATEHLMEEKPPFMNGNLSEGEYGSQIVAKFNNKNSYQNQQLDT